jgi:hypothetical protein
MIVYLGKDRKCATMSMAPTHATVKGLAARIEHVGHRLCMDSFFSSPALRGLCGKYPAIFEISIIGHVALM